MRGDVLVVVIGVLCWHPGSSACWKDNRPVGGESGGERESQIVHFLIPHDEASTQVVDN